MGITSLQVCMDASEWLQGTMNPTNDDCVGGGGGMDSSSSPTSAGDHHQNNNNYNMLCSRPAAAAAAAHMMDRRLRPPHDQILKCPRCDSTHTKFCYYNNYSLSQPRYFCKTCRRYWTKGGTLRNIPVGGGCRKNKKSSPSSKKSTTSSSGNGNNNSIDNSGGYNNNNSNTDISAGLLINQNNLIMGSSSGQPGTTELQLAFPGPALQFSPLISSLIGGGAGSHTNFLESKYNALLENIHYTGSVCGGGGGNYINHSNNNYNTSSSSCRPIDFVDHQQKFDALVMGHTTRNLHGSHADSLGNNHDHHHRLMGSSLGLPGDDGVDFSILGGGGAGAAGVGMGFITPDHHQIQHHLTTPSTNFNNTSHQQFTHDHLPTNHHPNSSTNTLNMMMMDNNRLILPYHDDDDVTDETTTASGVVVHDVKPSLNKILTLEWQDHHQQHGGTSTTTMATGGGGINNASLGSSSWTSMMNGYGQSPATNHLI